MNHCATCGASLPPASQFCPRCGADLREPTAVVPPPAPAVPPSAPAAKSHWWWLVPLVIIGVVVIAFLLLMGLPFGGRDKPASRASAPATETIAEGEAPPSTPPVATATLEEIGEPAPVTTTTAAAAPPPVATTTVAPPAPRPTTTVGTPPPMTSAAPPSEPARKEIPPRSGEIGESEAVATLRGFLVTRNYYDTGAGCLRVTSTGYRNVGYTLDVHDSCASRRLGRWRVDAKTREVFRQRDDGRFLRP